MKNIDKYNYEIQNETIHEDGNLNCALHTVRTKNRHCTDENDSCLNCTFKSLEWLNAEYIEPIRLTKAEKVILENLDKKYKWICRDETERMLKVYDKKPLKAYGGWLENLGYDYVWLRGYIHLFQFIKHDTEPLEIAWLLENCEVIEE